MVGMVIFREQNDGGAGIGRKYSLECGSFE